MKIDAHQHFWNYDAGEYPWITDEKSVLKRNFLPADLAQEQKKVSFDGSIAVQARQTIVESRWLLELAEHDTRIKGIVGWVDLRSEKIEEQLKEFVDHPKFAGVRHVVQDEPDDQFMLRLDFFRGLAKLAEFDFAYDLLIFPKQLPAAIEVVKRFPKQTFVLDHMAKPSVRDGIILPWKELIEELASYPNVSCKVSGIVTEARWRSWKRDDFAPYLDVVAKAFGEDRLMVGSDWPVCLLSADYGEVISLAHNYFEQFAADVQKKIFGENALRIYGLSIR